MARPADEGGVRNHSELMEKDEELFGGLLEEEEEEAGDSS